MGVNRMVFTIKNLCDACGDGNIQTVRDIVTSKEVDVNHTDYHGNTPLMHAMDGNRTEVVRFLLNLPELELHKRNAHGMTALQRAYNNSNVAVVRLFCQDRRCTPSVVNIKDTYGRTALMQ